MKRIGFITVCLFAIVFAFSGCATAKYQSELPAGQPRSADYPIPLYMENQKVPRACEIIGTVSINPGSFVMFRGSPETETRRILEMAHEKGADAVKVTSMEKPDFTNPNYRMKADLLRYSEDWETVAITEKELVSYLAEHRDNLDPIEGIWIAGGLQPETIGIIRDHSKPGREFVGFILQSQNPVWHLRMKKMDIRRGPGPGSYAISYYLDDFERREISIMLANKNSFALTIWRSNDRGAIITYTKTN
ncbi:MAG TPA: DUF1471 domain-containing protein [Verrucomicrobiae bacterium]|nr:DUF1471 domain-containing protein [Verrucomicrobiae bacterium]